MQNGLGPARRDLEPRAVVGRAAGSGGSVEIAIAALDQAGIGVAAARGEGKQNALGPARRDLEARAASARAATCGGSVDIAIAALNQTGIGDADEGIKNALRPARRDLEDRAVIAAAARVCGSIEIAVAALNQSMVRICRVAAAPGKGMQKAEIRHAGETDARDIGCAHGAGAIAHRAPEACRRGLNRDGVSSTEGNA